MINNKQQTINGTSHVSINDLREKEYSGLQLSLEEKAALENFDSYRIQYLNSSETEDEFSRRYLEMQVKANLSTYLEFLKTPYCDRLINN